MATKISIRRRVKYHVDHARRRIRFHLTKPFSRYSIQPPAKGRIICHLNDFNASGGLAEQLQYLADRDVMTFRIYTDRKSYVEDTLRDSSIGSSCSAVVIEVQGNSNNRNRIWRSVDRYNWAQSHDKWTLILNTGEYFLYPHSTTRTIPDLCQFLSDEHRRALFCIVLDAYFPRFDAPSFVHGVSGWRIDRYGYEFRYSGAHDTDLWHGGFTYRFQNQFGDFGRKHVTRIPLQKIGRKAMPSRDLVFALPPKVSTASSTDHLSPTGCILSSECFEHWKSRSRVLGQNHDFEKLGSAPSIPITWNPVDLIEFGFMNEGQWL